MLVSIERNLEQINNDFFLKVYVNQNYNWTYKETKLISMSDAFNW